MFELLGTDARILLEFAIFLLVLVFVSYCVFKLHSIGRIIKKTESRADKKLAKTIEEDFENRLSEILSSISAKLEKEAEIQLKKVSVETLKLISRLEAGMENTQKGMAAQSQVLIANNFSRIQKELEAYREAQMKKIDQQIKSIIFAASREVIGRTISPQEHEDLVRVAIERAKREKFFLK